MYKNIFILVLFLQTLSLFAQKSLTLKECIAQAEKHSPQTELLPLIEEASRLQVALLQKNYLPQSNVNVQSTWQSATSNVPIDLPGMSIPKPSKLQYKLTLDVTQSIWDGGVTKQQQRIAQASAAADVEKVKVDLYVLHEQVCNLFFGVVLADKQLGNIVLLRKDLEKKRAKTANLKEGGLATNYQLLAIDARLIELEQQISEVQSRKSAALEALVLLTNNKDILEAKFKTENIVPSTNLLELKRPELVYFEAQKKAIEASEELIKAKNMPKIGAFATAGLGRPGLNFLSNDLSPYFIGGVQVRVPITQYYSKSEHIERQQLRINRDKIGKMQENFVWLTQIKAASQAEELKRFETLLANDERLITLRQDMLITANVQLDNGIITPNDYIIEANNVDIARQNKALHEVQYLQAIYNLNITLGK